jgi:hypothetical protein
MKHAVQRHTCDDTRLSCQKTRRNILEGWYRTSHYLLFSYAVRDKALLEFRHFSSTGVSPYSGLYVISSIILCVRFIWLEYERANLSGTSWTFRTSDLPGFQRRVFYPTNIHIQITVNRRFKSSDMLHLVDWWMVTDVSVERSAFTFKSRSVPERTLLAKMKALRSFETSSIYHSTRRNIEENLNFQHHRFENLKSRNCNMWWTS